MKGLIRHAYIHVPFCRRRCSYCDFSIAVKKQVPGADFVNAISREIEIRNVETEPLETLYLGGGTPSLLEASDISRLIGLFDLASGAEVTLEANPEDVTPSSVGQWLDAGVTRVSLGAQSLNDEILEWMHRPHDSAGALKAIEIVAGAGFDSFSVDVIIGLPERFESFAVPEVELLASISVPHLSVYGLTVEDSTPLGRWVSRGRERPASESRFESDFLAVHEKLVSRGYQHYEVSNYARPGQRSRHNSAYWTAADYEALGPAAHRLDASGGRRSWNLRAWSHYLDAINAGTDPTDGAEWLSGEARTIEKHYLGFRTDRGVDREHIHDGVARTLLTSGWARETEGCLALTPTGWLRMDAIVALTTSREGG